MFCKDKATKRETTKLLDFIDHDFIQTTDRYLFMITYI